MVQKQTSHKRLKVRENFIATPGSTATRYVNYEENDKIVEVQFPTGNIYQYLDVPGEIWNEYRQKIESGESSGQFLNKVIKKFAFRPVRERRGQ